MNKFYVGDVVGYERETKEWKIIKAELTVDSHGTEDVEYTIKKFEGKDIGRTEKVLAGVLS